MPTLLYLPTSQVAGSLCYKTEANCVLQPYLVGSNFSCPKNLDEYLLALVLIYNSQLHCDKQVGNHLLKFASYMHSQIPICCLKLLYLRNLLDNIMMKLFEALQHCSATLLCLDHNHTWSFSLSIPHLNNPSKCLPMTLGWVVCMVSDVLI